MPHLDVRSARILVVDDEPANVELLQYCLAEFGYRDVIACGSGSEALDAYAAQGGDLILLDLHMPGIDGFSVIERLRERVPVDQYLPILVLTADATAETRTRALSSGAQDFLTKPLDIAEVRPRIRNLLETRFLHEQQRVARADAERAGRRALVLAEASHVLASSFDYHTTLALLCRSIVPDLADFCTVDVLEEQGAISRVGVAHADPSLEPILREASLHADHLPPDHPLLLALREGRETLLEEVTREMMGLMGDEGQRSLVEQLAPRSAIFVPLLASGHVTGALVLVNASSGRRFGPADLELAGQLARRAALTIENARLFMEAQEATRARDEMLAVVAHDLRNPLSTISLGSEMLREEAGTPSQEHVADMVHRAADRMRRLIDDLLEVSRIERGRLHLEVRDESLNPIIREAVAMLHPVAEAAGVRLHADLPPQAIHGRIDGARILQVLSNLLGNAIKFTDPGGEVRVSCRGGPDGIRVEVADTGQGIPPEQIPHIFSRYWQASDSDSRGVGLGLSIVRGVVRGHGGEIWVESEVGRGSVFTFTVPPARGAAADGVEADSESAPPASGSPRVPPGDGSRAAPPISPTTTEV
jgi:signal transduction histidine kinase/CheY-like chemotaxis protein